MSTATNTVFAYVAPDREGFYVACSCGYFVSGWPQQSLAQADLHNHWQRCHAHDEGDEEHGG